ncbi:hypothetical protein LUX12_20360 [Streptomyces somaliensis]|uniref:Uncharacterized protein n=1 Tax=Streptomyces somaliensis (strain ATCC 33201 / DSM 40738 / JCM 12659 / KCTC 9044 / NCTC 11332 / NRRL B-12077 / IP 733) TaxID=1134445 RepID=A0AA44ID16_STRE0|nr:hypothetical protein [Streptomyces somaliensis]MCP9946604.1 hypothetical protein [Streptomyces somaliensis]MCP9960258.1 hypothetical protein [Streptomyces somaliensis]MCP9973024.1 hypothetical protein [Streptomyces somaliensis]MCQ0021815.1 hypothetical protein [Streptomyces somaliensis DSM 40738]NKY14211.1 hypothetical protein [Streptomyces somaliensis DSM 40738]
MSKPAFDPFDPAVPDADALNRAIRELWARSDGRLSADEQRIYQALVLKWAAAQQGDVDAAA